FKKINFVPRRLLNAQHHVRLPKRRDSVATDGCTGPLVVRIAEVQPAAESQFNFEFGSQTGQFACNIWKQRHPGFDWINLFRDENSHDLSSEAAPQTGFRFSRILAARSLTISGESFNS